MNPDALVHRLEAHVEIHVRTFRHTDHFGAKDRGGREDLGGGPLLAWTPRQFPQGERVRRGGRAVFV